MKGLQDVVNQAKALVQRLREKETAVEATLKDVNTLSEQLSAMRQFREESVVAVAAGKSNNQANSAPPKQVAESNSDGENQSQQQQNGRKEKQPAKKDQLAIAHQPIVLALLSENRRLAALESENVELVKCLEEYQAALDMVMHKYRSHVTKFASANQILSATIADMGQRAQKERTETELRLLDRINDMAKIMQRACELDDSYYTDVVGVVTRLHNENKCLRELLDARITNNDNSTTKPSDNATIRGGGGVTSLPLPPPPQNSLNCNSNNSNTKLLPSQPTVSQLLLNGVLPHSFSSSSPTYQSVIYQNNSRNSNNSEQPSCTPSSSSSASETSSSSSSSNSNMINGLPLRSGALANLSRISMPPSSSSSYLSSSSSGGQQQTGQFEFKLPRRPLSAGGVVHSPPLKKPEMPQTTPVEAPVEMGEEALLEDVDTDETGSTISSVSTATTVATLCQQELDDIDVDDEVGATDGTVNNNHQNDENQEDAATKNEIDELVNEMMNLDATTTQDTTVVVNE